MRAHSDNFDWNPDLTIRTHVEMSAILLSRNPRKQLPKLKCKRIYRSFFWCTNQKWCDIKFSNLKIRLHVSCSVRIHRILSVFCWSGRTELLQIDSLTFYKSYCIFENLCCILETSFPKQNQMACSLEMYLILFLKKRKAPVYQKSLDLMFWCSTSLHT